MSERLQIRKSNKSTGSPASSNQSKLLNKNEKPLMLHPPLFQTKPAISQPGDKYEQEADRIAEAVVKTPDSSFLQCKYTRCDKEEKKVLQPKELPGQVTATRSKDVPLIVHEVLRSPGQPLDPATRTFMEPRFGHDFSQVRVHTDAKSAKSAKSVNALAYTVGKNIIFGAGKYAPNTSEGRWLLAHELTHFVQQHAPSGYNDTKAVIMPMRQSGKKTEVENAALPLDYKRIADQIHKAIAGFGTDEEAVYRALQKLDRNQAAIEKLKEVYLKEQKASLIEDIYDDFSGTEREYALQLINEGISSSRQRIEPASMIQTDITLAATRIREAVEGMGTDEEAIFSVLLPFKQKTLKLQNEYYRLYHEDMRDRLVEELSGSELDYALELLETLYEHYIQEANEKLASAPFGNFGNLSTYCLQEYVATSEGSKAIYWYDKEYWEPGNTNVQGKGTCRVVLLPNKSPAAAIDAIFDHQDRWKIACAEFVQITHLYALRHTLGAKRFNQRMNSGKFMMEIKSRESTGVETEILFSRTHPPQQMVRSDTGQNDPRPVDEILASTPIGSRVRWTNSLGESLNDKPNPWQNENTIKLGPNKFGAHGSATGIFTKSNTHTREEIELLVARGTNPKADTNYVEANIFISEIEIFRDASRHQVAS